jgi:glyoxylase-like metal-dependent hydrolase (beta-lactamase superfamily II)
MYPGINEQMSRRAMMGMAGAAVIGSSAIAKMRLEDKTMQPAAKPEADAAAAPVKPTGRVQAYGSYAMDLGGISVRVIADGDFGFGPSWPLFNAAGTKAEVDAHLARQGIPPQPFRGQVHTLLIERGADRVMIDTGCGTSFGPDTGRLTRHLAAIGLEQKDINLLIVSHCHPDHINGYAEEGKPTGFSNAKLVLAKTEADFWSGPADLSGSKVDPEMAKLMRASAGMFVNGTKAKTQLMADRDSVIDGVKLVAAPGHTPGHMMVEIAGSKQKMLFITDLIHHAAVGFSKPAWHVAFDADPVMAAKTRQSVLAQVVAEKTLIAGSHLPFPGFGHVVEGAGNDEVFRFMPMAWQF